MAAGHELASQGDRRERVPRIPERGQEQPPAAARELRSEHLRDVADHLLAPLGVGRDRGDDEGAHARVAIDREPVAHLVERPRRSPPCRSARPAAPRRPRPSCRPGRGPAPSAPPPRTRSGARARCRSSSRASPSRPRRARAGAAPSRGRGRCRRRCKRSPTGAMSNEPFRSRPARAAPSWSSSRDSPTCSGEKKIGIQPSAISPVSCMFLGPIAAM